MTGAKENPGAADTATGAETKTSAKMLRGEDTPTCPVNAIQRFALDRHKRAARALGYALIADDPATWTVVGGVLALRLTPEERAHVARAACGDLPGAGVPLPPLTTTEAEAESWAAFADRRELRAYARACLARLHPNDRQRIAGDLSRQERRAA